MVFGLKGNYDELREDGQPCCQGTCWDNVGNGYRIDRQCSRVGRFFDEDTGKLYCGTHHPGKAKERNDEKHAKWEEQYRNEQAWRKRQDERERAALDAVEFLRAIVKDKGVLGANYRYKAERIIDHYDANLEPSRKG